MHHLPLLQLVLPSLYVLPCLTLPAPIPNELTITYWIDDSCKNLHENFEKALAEALWTSGRVSDSLYQFDNQMIEPVLSTSPCGWLFLESSAKPCLQMRWFFNVDENNRAGRVAIAETYRRIWALKEEEKDRKKANIRFVCNADADLKAVHGDGSEMSNPPTDPETQEETKYYSEKDDYYALGEDCLCAVNEDTGLTVDIGQANNNARPTGTDIDMDQEGNRFVIYLCPRWLDSLRKHKLPFTVRDYAQYDLENQLEDYTHLGDLPMVLLIHELTHIPMLSSQDFRYPVNKDQGPEVAFTQDRCEDEHGPNKIDGYFMDAPGNDDLPGPRLGDWKYGIMNADSYGFFAVTYRLRDKQWKAKAKKDDDDDEEYIELEKDTTLPLKGDWDSGSTRR